MLSFEKSPYKDYDKYVQYRRRQRKLEKQRIKRHIDSLKTDCLFCGATDDLIFHHVNPNEKKNDVAGLYTIKAVNEEIEKCWCLCESCHTKLHQRLCDPLPSTYASRCSVH